MTNKEIEKNEEFPNWYDLKVFSGNLEEFKELYGKESELVNLKGPYSEIVGSYITYTDKDNAFIHTNINPTNDYINKIKVGKVVGSGIKKGERKKRVENFNKAVFGPSSLLTKLKKIQADGIIRASELKDISRCMYGIEIDSFLGTGIHGIFLKGIPVRSEEMKKRYKL